MEFGDKRCTVSFDGDAAECSKWLPFAKKKVEQLHTLAKTSGGFLSKTMPIGDDVTISMWTTVGGVEKHVRIKCAVSSMSINGLVCMKSPSSYFWYSRNFLPSDGTLSKYSGLSAGEYTTWSNVATVNKWGTGYSNVFDAVPFSPEWHTSGRARVHDQIGYSIKDRNYTSLSGGIVSLSNLGGLFDGVVCFWNNVLGKEQVMFVSQSGARVVDLPVRNIKGVSVAGFDGFYAGDNIYPSDGYVVLSSGDVSGAYSYYDSNTWNVVGKGGWEASQSGMSCVKTVRNTSSTVRIYRISISIDTLGVVSASISMISDTTYLVPGTAYPSVSPGYVSKIYAWYEGDDLKFFNVKNVQTAGSQPFMTVCDIGNGYTHDIPAGKDIVSSSSGDTPPTVPLNDPFDVFIESGSFYPYSGSDFWVTYERGYTLYPYTGLFVDDHIDRELYTQSSVVCCRPGGNFGVISSVIKFVENYDKEVQRYVRVNIGRVLQYGHGEIGSNVEGGPLGYGEWFGGDTHPLITQSESLQSETLVDSYSSLATGTSVWSYCFGGLRGVNTDIKEASTVGGIATVKRLVDLGAETVLSGVFKRAPPFAVSSTNSSYCIPSEIEYGVGGASTSFWYSGDRSLNDIGGGFHDAEILGNTYSSIQSRIKFFGNSSVPIGEKTLYMNALFLSSVYRFVGINP